jgi:hypothetical protein
VKTQRVGAPEEVLEAAGIDTTIEECLGNCDAKRHARSHAEPPSYVPSQSGNAGIAVAEIWPHGDVARALAGGADHGGPGGGASAGDLLAAPAGHRAQSRKSGRSPQPATVPSLGIRDRPYQPPSVPSAGSRTAPPQPATAPSVGLGTERYQPYTAPSVGISSERYQPYTAPSIGINTEQAQPLTIPAR